jgi:hypothetical protein
MADMSNMPFGFAPSEPMKQTKQPPLRPFRPGEQITNPDGSYSTEVTTTVEDGRGGWMVIPQLWMSPNGVVDLRDKPDLAASTAIHLRDNFGLQFPSFKTVSEADMFARQRSDMGGAGQGSIVRPPYGR